MGTKYFAYYCVASAIDVTNNECVTIFEKHTVEDKIHCTAESALLELKDAIDQECRLLNAIAL